jgi:hypothetical protein
MFFLMRSEPQISQVEDGEKISLKNVHVEQVQLSRKEDWSFFSEVISTFISPLFDRNRTFFDRSTELDFDAL